MEIFQQGLKADFGQVQEICARHDISRETYAQLMRKGREALAEVFAAQPPGRPRKDAVYGAAAARIHELQSRVEQATNEATALCRENTALKLALAYTRKLLRIFSGGESGGRFLRYRPQAVTFGALKCQVARWVQEQSRLVVCESLGLQTPWEALSNVDMALRSVPGQEIIEPEGESCPVGSTLQGRLSGLENNSPKETIRYTAVGFPAGGSARVLLASSCQGAYVALPCETRVVSTHQIPCSLSMAEKS